MTKIGFILLFILISCLMSASDFARFSKALIQIEHKKIVIELADNPHTWQRGLMYRKSLKEDEGMLFIFLRSEILSFWMKNTYIPLDIGFFDGNKKLLEVRSLKPHDTTIIDSSQPAKYALEMNKGWFKKNGIKKGAKLSIIKKLTSKK